MNVVPSIFGMRISTKNDCVMVEIADAQTIVVLVTNCADGQLRANADSLGEQLRVEYSPDENKV
jgi:hypothetical protein